MASEIKVFDETIDFTQIQERLYIGMDVGGTKIRTSLVSEAGQLFAHLKQQTPRDCEAEITIETMQSSIHELLEHLKIPLSRISAIGIAVPGVVEPETGNVVVTPNMNLTGIPLGKLLSTHFGMPVFLSNDGNLGTLGETWLGAARNAQSVVGIFVGTGVGSGIVINGRLWSGAGYAAGEIGHIVVETPARSWKARIDAILPPNVAAEMQQNLMEELPVCGCGNIGCLESLASRTAIEHAIQEAVKLGIPSKITEFTDPNVSIVKAGALAKALKAQDPLVTAIVHYTAEVLAYACLTVRHLIDPEVIIFGGGVMEACHRYILPIIEQIVSKDKLPAAPSNRRIVLSQLGDDAVVLGAVALARARTDHIENPIEAVTQNEEKSKLVWNPDSGTISAGDTAFDADFMMNSAAQPVVRTEKDGKIHRSELKALCGPTTCHLIVGARDVEKVKISQKGLDFLTIHGVYARICTLEEGVEVYNHATQPSIAIFLMGASDI